jgi:hypothetical protein
MKAGGGRSQSACACSIVPEHVWRLLLLSPVHIRLQCLQPFNADSRQWQSRGDSRPWAASFFPLVLRLLATWEGAATDFSGTPACQTAIVELSGLWLCEPTYKSPFIIFIKIIHAFYWLCSSRELWDETERVREKERNWFMLSYIHPKTKLPLD